VIAEPSRRLAPNARWVWRLGAGIVCGVALIAGMIAAGPLDGALAVLARVVPLAALLVGVVIVPELRWRRWRWDISPETIDIRHGTVTVRRTLIPMVRVQHVDTTSDLIEQWMGLASVEVHTAADSHKIPLLTMHDAEQLREQIAELARTADEP
jgi:membrane protein YdbS with pleckstrin-like domain